MIYDVFKLLYDYSLAPWLRDDSSLKEFKYKF